MLNRVITAQECDPEKSGRAATAAEQKFAAGYIDKNKPRRNEGTKANKTFGELIFSLFE